MKQLDNQNEKSYTVKFWPQHNTVEAWSIHRLPFEPKGWFIDFRNDLRIAIHSLQSHPGQILHATYAASQSGFYDIENILFYNVGPGHFTSLMTTGLRTSMYWLMTSLGKLKIGTLEGAGQTAAANRPLGSSRCRMSCRAETS